ncbi:MULTISPECIES: tetratricopeptide repeat protein [Nocardiopsis]|uniref:Thioredoxin n=1 Tax=Nocardiopsis dassonvillei (strain ATCC 23218 / DSM 43111 / CIP 107115 / JCM 7437 / KCTC 9190 / NBRC 14626 / NCTC 10488 / NRRL B-5397 / IMRU 509) TaxID=446468 RepID=D7AVF1_NOCDD|nr:tetratricopeptide repeat protein [Nocardiopsis dassonvillei]ADH65812.1 putative thioredoxin [Nocardiopsis dassonvillei subsp. dassonvillei DSM 43111]APC34151.1 co-chaperone YbbN [Nocardiopsis dassonvillei]NKY78766.1 tetratricopeptide repeat protein [Nocardiopsis dassonvillei]VEI91833.1 Thioredoxin [Nocardiopsis dassonvillei]
MQPSDFSPNSAVDLGARKAAMEREAKQRAAESAGRSNPYAVNVDEATFQAQVLERSMSTPVVLAVLAGWSEQSKQVEDALDKISAASGGTWFLAKVDSEASPQLVQALRVPTTPMIVVVIQGQLLPGPAGPATEEQLTAWLVEAFAALKEQGALPPGHPGTITGEPGAEGAQGAQAAQPEEPQGRPVDIEAQEALDRGDFEAAAAVYAKAVEADSGDTESRAKLAQVRLVGRLQEVDAGAALQAAADRPEDVAAQTTAADVEMYGGRFEDAFARLVDTVRITSDEDRDRARTHLLGLFELLPPGDPRVNAARRKLTSALF